MFLHRGARWSPLARPLPIDHRLLGAARGRIVLGHELRLGLHRGGNGFYHLGNVLVILLAGAPQQGLNRAPASGDALPTACAAPLARHGSAQAACRQATHGVARLWLVLDRRRRMG